MFIARSYWQYDLQTLENYIPFSEFQQDWANLSDMTINSQTCIDYSADMHPQGKGLYPADRSGHALRTKLP